MMRRSLAVLALSVLVAVAVPLTVTALSLNVGATGGAGLSIGSTTNPNETGAARVAAVGGLAVQFYPLSVGKIDLGLSAGAEYAYLNFHGVINNISIPYLGTTALTTDSTYNYVNFSAGLAGRVPISNSIMADLTVGGFVGDFLSGSAKYSYNPQIAAAGLTSGTQTLDSTTTAKLNWGLQFTGGVDFKLAKNLWLSPVIEYNLGLSNTDNESGYQYKETFSSLTAQIGAKYSLF